MTARILPSQEYLRECFDYDPDTGTLRWRVRPVAHFDKPGKKSATWTANIINSRCAGRAAGAIFPCSSGLVYLAVRIDNCLFLAHRVIWKLLFDDEPPEIDHRNNIGTNNWLGNLRAATRPTNNHNTRGWKRHELPKGVRHHRTKYQARITAHGTVHHLGTFDTPDAAAEAYKNAADTLHGEFANYGHCR